MGGLVPGVWAMSITVNFNGRSALTGQKTTTTSAAADGPSTAPAAPSASASHGEPPAARGTQGNPNSPHTLRVEALRTAVANGTYQPDAVLVAEKALQESLAYLGTSSRKNA